MPRAAAGGALAPDETLHDALEGTEAQGELRGQRGSQQCARGSRAAVRRPVPISKEELAHGCGDSHGRRVLATYALVREDPLLEQASGNLLRLLRIGASRQGRIERFHGPTGHQAAQRRRRSRLERPIAIPLQVQEHHMLVVDTDVHVVGKRVPPHFHLPPPFFFWLSPASGTCPPTRAGAEALVLVCSCRLAMHACDGASSKAVVQNMNSRSAGGAPSSTRGM